MSRRRLLRLATAVALTVAPSGLGTAAEYNRFLAGGWSGGAHRSGDTGEFTHCAISKTYPKGIVVVYGLSRDGEFDLFLGSEAWRLRKGAYDAATLSIDGARLGQFPAGPIGENLLKISLGAGTDAIEALRRGKILTVNAMQRKFDFRLVGTAQALPRLQRCVESETATAGSRGNNPFERTDEARNPFKPGQAQTPRAYTRNEVANILSRAGIRDPEFFSDDEMRQYPGFGYMWTEDGKIGFVSQFLRDPGASVDEQAARFMARLTNDCKGKVSSGARPATTQGAFIFKERFASCTGERHDFHAYAVAVFEPSRVSVFGYMGWDAEGRASADQATAKLGGVLRQMYF
jgi:hypothetical protein